MIAVINEQKIDIRDFVHSYYSAENLFRTWQPGFESRGTIEAWPDYKGVVFVPDPAKIVRGRRKHLRIPMSMDEMQKEMKRKNKCSKCGKRGHNKTKCRAPSTS